MGKIVYHTFGRISYANIVSDMKGGAEMRRQNRKGGTIAVAFGAGFLVSWICPTRLLVSILAIALIVVGLSHLRT